MTSLQAALQKLLNLSYWTRLAADTAILSLIGDQKLVANYSIGELTYEGQYNTLVALSKMKEGFLEGLSALGSEDNKKGKFGFAVDVSATFFLLFLIASCGRKYHHEK